MITNAPRKRPAVTLIAPFNHWRKMPTPLRLR